MAISYTGVMDTQMEVYKFRRALTEITGMELRDMNYNVATNPDCAI